MPIMVKKPARENIMKDGDTSSEGSNMVAKVRRTASGHSWHPSSSSSTSLFVGRRVTDMV